MSIRWYTLAAVVYSYRALIMYVLSLSFPNHCNECFHMLFLMSSSGVGSCISIVSYQERDRQSRVKGQATDESNG